MSLAQSSRQAQAWPGTSTKVQTLASPTANRTIHMLHTQAAALRCQQRKTHPCSHDAFASTASRAAGESALGPVTLCRRTAHSDSPPEYMATCDWGQTATAHGRAASGRCTLQMGRGSQGPRRPRRLLPLCAQPLQGTATPIHGSGQGHLLGMLDLRLAPLPGARA
jgi:hypothetical protein